MEEKKVCIFCGLKLTMTEGDREDTYKCRCDNCGNYEMTYEAFEDLPYELEKKHKDKKHLISGFLREMTELNLPTELIRNDNFNNLLTNSKIPRSIIEKLDKLLLHLYRKTNYLHEEIVLDITQIQSAIGYAKNNTELENMLTALSELGYLKKIEGRGRGGRVCVLTIKGMDRSEKQSKESVESKQGFVAMWFSDEMLDIFNKYISNAISDSGYNPFIIPMKEHNEDICDNIITEIRKSKFLIADFTGQRGGAYFEAGFAYGLGLPVIWTCSEDWFNKTVEKEVDVKIDGKIQKGLYKEERFTHFDVNHYNFIVWKDGKDLYEKLKNRILATII